LLLLRLSSLKAHFEIKTLNYTPLHMNKVYEVPFYTMEPWIFERNLADQLLKIYKCL